MLRGFVIGLASFALLGADAPPSPSPSPAPSPAPAVPAGPNGQLRGAVTSARHEPVVGAVVLCRPENAPSPLKIATTGTNGSFAFDGLTDGAYRAEVRHEAYVSIVKMGIQVRSPFRAVIEVLMMRGETPREPSSDAPGNASLSGTIRWARGTALAEARVRLTRPDGADEAKTLMSDKSGAFAVPVLKAGRWRLEVQGAGLLPLRTDIDLVGPMTLEAQLSPQPANYRPPAQDLIVPEDVIPPPAASR